MVVVKEDTISRRRRRRYGRQMPQVILQFPYAGVDFRGDPDMVLPPGEVFDHQRYVVYLYMF
jgi:hypothetical protein